jgi:starch synthase (maltosyl-transferring)
MNQLKQIPAPGGNSIHFRGDMITFTLENQTGRKGKAWLRTNIGFSSIRHAEIIRHVEEGCPPLSRDWHDLPMRPLNETTYSIVLPLLEVGRFEAKAYFVPSRSREILWPEGANATLKVEPAETCNGNTMYTAFVRQFGETKSRPDGAVAQQDEAMVLTLEQAGYAVIPPSGKFRDVIKQLDFIVGTLRCKIVQLLPIHPVPTTYARMGRYGSPFAVMDLMDVDPAYAEFDRQTTPMDQFQELVDEVHRRNARIYLDMPINHTGWASHLQIMHPEWFARNEGSEFLSPGAWGVIWGDLSKLDYRNRKLWRYIADVFLNWCSRGVDGFRCDAGYKVPFEVWQYIIAKVRKEYPDTIFMLEGLGGYKHVTERLLADAGMNWAYSELFQNYDQHQVEDYLPEAIRVAESKGNLIHFAETHDNARLADRSHAFARMRVAFCALSSYNGAFGFANGVEWYADRQINVHSAHSLNWGAEENMIDWIQRLHALMEIHPSFAPGGIIRMIQQEYHNSVALLRRDGDGIHPLLVLVNLNADAEGVVCWPTDRNPFESDRLVDLLSGRSITPEHRVGGMTRLRLAAGEVICLSSQQLWLRQMELRLKAPYRGTELAARQCLWAKALDIHCLLRGLEHPESVIPEALAADPKRFCLDLSGGRPCVTTFEWPRDVHRMVLLPPDHLLLIKSERAFNVDVRFGKENRWKEKSLPMADGRYFALVEPMEVPAQHVELTLKMTVFEAETITRTESPILALSRGEDARIFTSFAAGELHDRNRYAICTNDLGALSQVRIAWGELRSKYDGLLAANLHPSYPVDRHMMFTRCRGWIICRDYSTELSIQCQKNFSIEDDGTVKWLFDVPAGAGNLVPLELALRMERATNCIHLTYTRLTDEENEEHLDAPIPATLILRPDIEDRCNHEVIKAFLGAEAYWPTVVYAEKDGFTFKPAEDRQLTVKLSQGRFASEPEWYYSLNHPVDAERGIDGESDLFSPGYFRVELQGGESVTLTAAVNPQGTLPTLAHPVGAGDALPLTIEAAMAAAMRQFIVKRDAFKTVIAGYPWFLDWGRDTLICLRGIIAAGLLDDSEEIIKQFATFERNGTIPNAIHGGDANNRETSDAPLWMFVACDDLIKARGSEALLEADCGGRTLREVLISIASCYINGTENGIRMDWDSGLIYSPSHYTWMDTNYPAGTPREGYPIEIQALWHYALRFLQRIVPDTEEWGTFADQVRAAILARYVVRAGDATYLADCLAANSETVAADAVVDDALRCNQLFAITLGAVEDPELCCSILDACEQLLVPGAIRSLADLPVEHACPVYHNGQLLNDPHRPYWGCYSGDEDTRRKPAYHNGTAWTWPFPSYPEALVKMYGESAIPTALALLGSGTHLINNGCLRQSPEVVDGNVPHHQRGCGAQAWGVTELYRVYEQLSRG